MLFLPLGHYNTVPQAGLATVEQIQCQEKQHKMGATVVPPESSDSSTALEIGPYETICRTSR